MKFYRFAALALLTALASIQAGTDRPKSAPQFYAYCVETGVPGLTPRPLPKLAALLKDLGFDGIGLELALDGTLEANLKLLDQAGLQPFLFWTSVNVNPAQGAAYSPQLPPAIRLLKGRNATVSVLLSGLKPADPQGLQPAIRALRELGDVAAEAGVRLSIYNHVGNWTESLPFIVEVITQVDHPRVGFNFNLCHWLKVDGSRDWRPLLRQHAAKLFCVTINGATQGAQNWTNGLIRPLDEGDFDNRQLIALLAEIKYPGPVGLMCYGVPGEAGEYLGRSMKTWRSFYPAQPAPTEKR